MANSTTAKRARAEFSQRITQLIEKAGGSSEFCRHVWPREDVAANKAKVSKWKNGQVMIDPLQAIEVAKAFGRRPAWLMFGEQPETEGVTRSRAELGDDLRAEVLHRLSAHRALLPPAVTAVIERSLIGEVLLDTLTTRILREYVDSAEWLERRLNVQAARDELRVIAETRGISSAHIASVIGSLDTSEPPYAEFVEWSGAFGDPDTDEATRKAIEVALDIRRRYLHADMSLKEAHLQFRDEEKWSGE